MYSFILKRLFLISLLFLSSPITTYSLEIRVSFGSLSNSEIRRLQSTYGQRIQVKKSNGRSVVVNRLKMEEYLIGVLKGELDSSWPSEALKAQAVLARTYALQKTEENRGKNLPYDIENSIFNQVYRSTSSEKLKEAVQSTRGEILAYNGDLAQVFYHSCCGGGTTGPEHVWGGSYPFLQPVRDNNCKGTPYYEWEKTFSKSRLEKLLEIHDIQSLSVKKRDSSGRAVDLQIILKNGKIVEIKGHRFRMQINSSQSKVYFQHPEIIPSTLFYISNSEDSVQISGTGYGHGIGMCQWGARVMAQDGFTYQQILKHYFASLEIKKAYK